jgi:TonB family protein
MPMVDRSAVSQRPAEVSDRDRRSATRERAPKPENTTPFSKGNTPEKTEGAPPPPERSEDPAPTASSSGAASSTNVPSKVLPDVPALPSQPPGGKLSDSLRDLHRYLQDENFDNRRGGLTDQDPDIQFDAKGVDFGPWLRRFVAQVKRNWYVPQASMMHSGRVVIQFNVHRNGTITDLVVVRPASVTALTTSAFNALRLSNPTMALPAEYPTDSAFFTVTFHYNEGVRH